jgi:hypothetical protein
MLQASQSHFCFNSHFSCPDLIPHWLTGCFSFFHGLRFWRAISQGLRFRVFKDQGLDFQAVYSNNTAVAIRNQ